MSRRNEHDHLAACGLTEGNYHAMQNKPTTEPAQPNLVTWLARTTREAREMHVAARHHAVAALRAGDHGAYQHFTKIEMALADLMNATR
jgi:hypothetical protein